MTSSKPRNKQSNKPRLCFIGFGEAGQAIASGLPITIEAARCGLGK